jgi:hypothetical protein
MGSAWLSGLNLYAAVVTLGLLEHFGLAHLPGELGLLGRWWIIGLAAALYLIEFVADKVPAVDSLWDTIHTFIRVPAGLCWLPLPSQGLSRRFALPLFSWAVAWPSGRMARRRRRASAQIYRRSQSQTSR